MPFLNDDKRQSINSRITRHNEIMKVFENKQFTSQYCRLCNWASNGLTLDEAIQENGKHEATHPELTGLDATLFDFDEIRVSLHDHECKMELCACKCGCKEGPFCTLVFGPLCSVCQVREMRGDCEHGLPDDKDKSK